MGAIVIATSIRKKEFKKGLIPPRDFEIIITAFGKGIYSTIKGESLPAGSKLIKIYATTVHGTRRVVFLVDVESGDGFFLFYRSKNDKIGSNISIKNTVFRTELKKYLRMLNKDIRNGDIEIYEE